jgi:RNA polymerase sigma-70 factor (ECF subfamily)
VEERAAVERLKRGDIGGLEVLVRKHHTRAGRAAYLIVRDHALAEDVAQSAFVRAYEQIDQFDAGRPFRPWFMKIVVNSAVEVARRRERTTSYEKAGVEAPMAWLVDPAAGPHEQAEEAEQRRRVWEALEKLPPVQRAAVVQRYYLGMSEVEMSEGGGAPPGTIKSRLYAARRSLSKLLHAHVRVEDVPETRERSVPTGVPPPRFKEERP